MGRIVVRKDHAHHRGEAEAVPVESRPDDGRQRQPGREDDGLVARIARHVGVGGRVLVLGREAGAAGLSRALKSRGFRAVALDAAGVDLGDDAGAGTAAGGDDEGRFDAVVVADLLGRVADPRRFLRALEGRIRPGGALVVAVGGVAAVGDRLAIIDGGPLGARSGVFFTEEGLLGLLDESGYLVGHVDPIGDDGDDAPGRDWLIVAHPAPLPGLGFLRRRLLDLAEQGRDARREAESLRRQLAQAGQRLEILTGHGARMAGRVKDLRARLLEAHAEMIRRDDEIRRTFGDVFGLRNALIVERDALLAQRSYLLSQCEALLAERDALLAERDALLAERDGLLSSLHEVGQRFDRISRSPLGLAYRALRKLSRRRGA